MYEVCIKLQFSEPCLGNIRKDDPEPNMMEHNADGDVIFPAVWWRSVVIKAANVYSRHQGVVKDILWTPEVDGTLKEFKRYYKTKGESGEPVRRYKKHEAFLRGDIIGLRALIPDGIPINEFAEIMTLAGSYFGISPFGWRAGYGKFQVLSVELMRNRRKRQSDDSNSICEGQHASGTPDNAEDNTGG